ncbi:MAG: hypothetical protein JAY72_20485 [Candidatus Thiodiazotropha endolucinida]|nr:hypothetical protein [Candidatus Thiodiazotropha taylori]MCW4324060.1 hypothetical protein [Candidatus Thiodiazotropha taylori]
MDKKNTNFRDHLKKEPESEIAFAANAFIEENKHIKTKITKAVSERASLTTPEDIDPSENNLKVIEDLLVSSKLPKGAIIKKLYNEFYGNQKDEKKHFDALSYIKKIKENIDEKDERAKQALALGGLFLAFIYIGAVFSVKKMGANRKEHPEKFKLAKKNISEEMIIKLAKQLAYHENLASAGQIELESIFEKNPDQEDDLLVAVRKIKEMKLKEKS